MTTHKSLKAWQEAHRVVNITLDLARDHWRPHLSTVFDQLRRAALSAQINISEGFGFGSRPRFTHHLRIARGSAVEAGDLLELLIERREIPTDIGEQAREHCIRSQRLLMGLIKRYQTPSTPLT